MLISLQVWLNHFEYHATRLAVLPQGRQDSLTSEERGRIASSIATFQLGEQSEGRTLLRAARHYEQEHEAAPVARIMELFVAEEQHHAALLGAFMDQQGLSRKRTDWTDHVFRCLRRLAGFELHISVLVTAELIGKVYYRALEAATECRHLKGLCRILVADELAHIGFESELLRTMRAGRAPFTRTVVEITHRAFLACASLVVWSTHHRVLRKAGYRMRTFLRACDAQYCFYLMSPKSVFMPQALPPLILPCVREMRGRGRSTRP